MNDDIFIFIGPAICRPRRPTFGDYLRSNPDFMAGVTLRIFYNDKDMGLYRVKTPPYDLVGDNAVEVERVSE